MIREDYILAWIKRYVRWLLEIAGFIRAEDYQGAIRRIDVALRHLLGLGPDSVIALSEGEILARLTMGEPTQFVQDKCLLLAALLKQLGIVCAAQQRNDKSRDCFIQALHIMLGIRLNAPDLALPEYAPTVAELVELLRPYALPPRTYGALMIFHEQTGKFAKAEDALFALLEATPDTPEAIDIGVAFYQRLQTLPDDALVAGGLPRVEVEAGLAELVARQTKATA
ncbi:MAG: DUF6483 family protein [Limisphaerales bacterium]